MPVISIAMRTLFVGRPCHRVTVILTRLGRRGFGSYAIERMEQARELIPECKFELVISLERVDDGSAYDLMPLVGNYRGSLVAGVKSSSGYLWLTVLDHGRKVLGTSAMDYSQLETELEEVLTHRSPWATQKSCWVPAAPPRISREEPEPVAISIGPPEGRLRRSSVTGRVKFPLLAIRPLPLVTLGTAFPAAKSNPPSQE